MKNNNSVDLIERLQESGKNIFGKYKHNDAARNEKIPVTVATTTTTTTTTSANTNKSNESNIPNTHLIKANGAREEKKDDSGSRMSSFERVQNTLTDDLWKYFCKLSTNYNSDISIMSNISRTNTATATTPSALPTASTVR